MDKPFKVEIWSTRHNKWVVYSFKHLLDAKNCYTRAKSMSNKVKIYTTNTVSCFTI